MEIAGTVSSILSQKDGQVWSIAPDSTVYDAIALMAEKNIGALPVLAGRKVVGIITERDYTRKVVLKGKSSKDTAVKEIMTGALILAHPNDSVTGCMKTMTDRRVRHLPVVEAGQMLGIVSMGDIVRWVMETQAATIDQLEQYVTGAVPV
jgi:CBS domain-containing protein